MKFVVALLAAAVGVACSSTPTKSTEDGLPSRQMHTSTQNQASIDILLVVDHSSSMCEEQAALGQTINAFVDQLEAFIAVDFRIALVTTDAVTDRGAFRHHPRVSLDAQCNADRLVTAGTCKRTLPSWNSTGELLLNWQGDAFEKCRFACESSAECDSNLIDSSAGRHCAGDAEACQWQCTKSPFFDDTKSCARRPATEGCPSAEEMKELLGEGHNGVPFLTRQTRDLFPCIATMPSPESNKGKRRQPFRAALSALEAQGPNASQASSFLRNDAFLLVVFLTNEDDCSVSANTATPDGECCGSDDELMPITEVVQRIQKLKNDPSKILIASFGGDLPAAIASDDTRRRYSDWRCSVVSPTKVTTHACIGPFGEAAVASRFMELNRQLGRYSSFYSLCAEGGIPESLSQLATRVGTELLRTCLPSRVLRSDILQPWITSTDGTAKALSSDEFDFVRDESCPIAGDNVAIRILTPLAPGDIVSISYDLNRAEAQ